MPHDLHVGIGNKQNPFSVRSINFYRTWADRSMVRPCPISFFIFIKSVMILKISAISEYFPHIYFGLFRRVFSHYASEMIGWNAKGCLS
jgi:hypothetical protein